MLELSVDAEGKEKGLVDWGQTGGFGGGYRQMMQLAGDPALTKPFLQNPWVYACVMAIASSGCVMPGGLRTEEKARVKKSKLLDTLKRPNPLMSQQKLWRIASIYQLLFGETFLFLLAPQRGKDGVAMLPISEGQVPTEIWPVPGPLVTEELDPLTKLPKFWRVGAGEQNLVYPAHSVCQINEVDPHNVLRGIGPMQAAWRTAAKEFTLDRYDDGLLKNGGNPGGTLSVNGILTEPMLKLMREQWNAANTGADNHRKTAVLPLGTKYEPFGFTPQEMEFKDFRVWNREVVMSVFGVPRIILGLTDGVNYSGAVEARRIFYEASVLPKFDFMASEITYKLCGKIEGAERELEFFYDRSDLEALREGRDVRIDRAIKLFNQAGRSFNEACRIAGVELTEPVTDGDRMFLPASMQALPEEKAKYDAQVAAAKPAPVPAQRELDFNADTTKADAPTVTTDDALAKLRARAPAMLEETCLPFDERIAKRLGRVYRDYMLAVRARLKAIAGDETKSAPSPFEKLILTDDEVREMLGVVQVAFEAEIRAAMTQPFGAVFDAAAKDAALKIGSSSVFLTHVEPAVLQFLADKGVALAEGTMTTLARDVQHTIMRELANAPENVTTIGDAIRDRLEALVDQVEVMIDNLPARAMNIARTETTSIYGYAHRRTDEIAEMDSEWVTAGDEHVRASHQDLNGLVRAPGEEFGHGLRYPGDPQAGAADVVNCRCATIPRPRTTQ